MIELFVACLPFLLVVTTVISSKLINPEISTGMIIFLCFSVLWYYGLILMVVYRNKSKAPAMRDVTPQPQRIKNKRFANKRD